MEEAVRVREAAVHRRGEEDQGPAHDRPPRLQVQAEAQGQAARLQGRCPLPLPWPPGSVPLVPRRLPRRSSWYVNSTTSFLLTVTND
jgi:hypothetical protein